MFEDESAQSARHEQARRAIQAGIEAAQPRRVLGEAVEYHDETLRISGTEYSLEEFDQVLVLGGGNGAGQVAAALVEILGDRIDDGIVVTDNPAETSRVEMVEGTHPLPSEANVEGTSRLLELAAGTTENDLVLTVVTGGGSALLCAPTEELTLEEYRTLTNRLIESGATIDEINAVRKHVSRIKGGQLARALAPARTVGIVFSDVVGNRLDVIASGPIAPDESTYQDAIEVLDRHDVQTPDSVDRILTEGADGDRPETPRPGDAVFDRVSHHIVADNRTALDATAETLQQAGYETAILSDRIEGEASDVGGVHAQIALATAETGEPFTPPIALLSGGETTVTVRGDGTGGPNQEFALRAAIDIAGSDVIAGVVDTDGIDGATAVAGALVDGSTVPDTRRAEQALGDNDAFGYLDEQDVLLRSGPTGTNVNDLRLLLIGEP
jgi:hydroxypyruvate reductase